MKTLLRGSMDEWKRMLRVMGIIVTPFAFSFVIGSYFREDQRFVVWLIGAIVSAFVAIWIWICRSAEDAADI